MNRKRSLRQAAEGQGVCVCAAWGIRLIAGTGKLCASAGQLFQELGCSIDPEEMIGNLLLHQRKEVELDPCLCLGEKAGCHIRHG